MITNASVTIYNKVYDRDEGSNKYYRTVLKGVNWQDATKVLPSDTGVVSADVAEVYIPFLIDTEKKYCSPVNFNSEQEKDCIPSWSNAGCGKSDIAVTVSWGA